MNAEEPLDTASELTHAIARTIRRQPLSSLALAIGIGFVAGATISSRIARFALAAGARHVARELLKQIL